MTPDERVRPAATVILHRRNPETGDAEVYLVERSREVKFFPGYHAFPGGTLDKAERDAVAAEGVDAFARAAVRELAEEADVSCAPEALRPAGRLLTPPFGPVRYDTQFFLAPLPEGAECRIVDTGELVSGRWWTPRDALDAFARGEVPIPPPTLALLTRLADAADYEAVADAVEAENDRPHHERFLIEMHPRVYALPLRAPTLPPATTVVTYLIASERDLLVVDPGTPFEDEQEVLAAQIEGLLQTRTPRAILLTHHHGDHVGAAAFLKERFGFQVLAHPETAKRLPDGLVDVPMQEGNSFDLGTYAPTGGAWRLDVLHTPGHAPGHVALRDTRFGALVTGDLVSGVSTILVDPDDDGDMRAYLRSLERVIDLDPPIVLPAHGPALPGKKALVKTLEHRRMREARVRDALRKEPGARVERLATAAYEDTPHAHPALAAQQTVSILRTLESEGAARREGDAWHPVE